MTSQCGDATSKRERERARARAHVNRERDEKYMGLKREGGKAWRSLPSKWHHSGDAKSNMEREGGERARVNCRKR